MDDPLALDDRHTAVHADVLRRVVDRDEGVESPYRQFGTLVAKARTLSSFLVTVARERSCTDHGAIASECGIHAARQGPLLDVLGRHEAAVGRPLLPAVVTRANREMPGDAYFDLVERVPNYPDDVSASRAERRWLWKTQREAVYRTWAENAPQRHADDPRVTIP